MERKEHVPFDEEEEEEEGSMMDTFAKWAKQKIASGKKKRFAEIE